MCSHESGSAWGFQPFLGGVSELFTTNSACLKLKLGAAWTAQAVASNNHAIAIEASDRCRPESVELPGCAGTIDGLDTAVDCQLAVDVLDMGIDGMR